MITILLCAREGAGSQSCPWSAASSTPLRRGLVLRLLLLLVVHFEDLRGHQRRIQRLLSVMQRVEVLPLRVVPRQHRLRLVLQRDLRKLLAVVVSRPLAEE